MAASLPRCDVAKCRNFTMFKSCAKCVPCCPGLPACRIIAHQPSSDSDDDATTNLGSVASRASPKGSPTGSPTASRPSAPPKVNAKGASSGGAAKTTCSHSTCRHLRDMPCGSCATHCPSGTCEIVSHLQAVLARERATPAVRTARANDPSKTPGGASAATAHEQDDDDTVVLCAQPNCIRSPDDPCPMCPQHCGIDDCDVVAHLRARLAREKQAARCGRNRATVADEYCGDCPCGAPLSSHPRSAKSARPEPEAADAAISAVKFGLTPKLFLAHPVNLTSDKWNEMLEAITGKSLEDKKLDDVRDGKTKGFKYEKADNDSINLHEIARACDFPGGTIREFAGLLAAASSVTNHNAATPDGKKLTIPKARLCKGDTGTLHTEEAISEPIVHRAQRIGRDAYVKFATSVRETHRGDAVHYIKYEKEKGKRRSIIWPDRLTRQRFAAYKAWLHSRHPDWTMEKLGDYLATQWTLSSLDSALPEDMTAFFVQFGILQILHDLENWKVLGESLNALTTHLLFIYETFKVKVVLGLGNGSEWKMYIKDGGQPPGLSITATPKTKPPAKDDGRVRGPGRRGGGDRGGGGGGGGGDGGGGRHGGGRGDGRDSGHFNSSFTHDQFHSILDGGGSYHGQGSAAATGGGGRGALQRPVGQAPGSPGVNAIPLAQYNDIVQSKRGAIPAGTLPAASRFPPATPIWKSCMAPGCTAKPPHGFSTTPCCVKHNPSPTR
jgi:hypothetical protein